MHKYTYTNIYLYDSIQWENSLSFNNDAGNLKLG